MEQCFLREASTGRRFLAHPFTVLNFTQVKMAVSLLSQQNSVSVVLLTRLLSYLRIRPAIFQFLRIASLYIKLSLVSLILIRWARSKSNPLHIPFIASYNFHFYDGAILICLFEELLKAVLLCTFIRLKVVVIFSQILRGSRMMDFESIRFFQAAGGRMTQPLLVTRCMQENISPNLTGKTLTKPASSLSSLPWMMPSKFWLLLFALKNQKICNTLSINFLANLTSFSSLVLQLAYLEMTAMKLYSGQSCASLQEKQAKCQSYQMRCCTLPAQNLMILLRSEIVSIHFITNFYLSKQTDKQIYQEEEEKGGIMLELDCLYFDT